MACNSLTGQELDCKEGIAGIQEVFLVPLSEMIPSDIAFDVTTDEIEGLPTTTVYRYQLDKNLSTFTETLTYEDGGMIFFNQELTLVFKNLSAAKRKELNENVGRNRVVAFVRLISRLQDADKIVCLGLQRGLDATSIEGTSGTSPGDLQGYTVTLVGQEAESAAYLENYTTNPFDNFAGITVTPAYAT